METSQACPTDQREHDEVYKGEIKTIDLVNISTVTILDFCTTSEWVFRPDGRKSTRFELHARYICILRNSDSETTFSTIHDGLFVLLHKPSRPLYRACAHFFPSLASDNQHGSRRHNIVELTSPRSVL